VHGSANLIQTLLEHTYRRVPTLDLPARARQGKRLFDGGTLPAGLQLASSQTSSTGVIPATYRSGADIKGGSFVPHQPGEAELTRRAPKER
jgi:hypothetical protein